MPGIKGGREEEGREGMHASRPFLPRLRDEFLIPWEKGEGQSKL